MKVLSFLELMTDSNYFEYEKFYSEVLLTDDHPHFYKQPFKPELITELFEGWEYIDLDDFLISKPYEPDEGHFADYEYFIECDFPFEIYKIYHYKQELKEDLVRTPKPPRTLDEFITDCQRAGIILEWKK